MIITNITLGLIAMFCGANLLAKVKKESLGGLFAGISWLIILGSLSVIGYSGYKGFNKSTDKGFIGGNLTSGKYYMIIPSDSINHTGGKSSSAAIVTSQPPAQLQQAVNPDSINHTGGNK